MLSIVLWAALTALVTHHLDRRWFAHRVTRLRRSTRGTA